MGEFTPKEVLRAILTCITLLSTEISSTKICKLRLLKPEFRPNQV